MNRPPLPVFLSSLLFSQLLSPAVLAMDSYDQANNRLDIEQVRHFDAFYNNVNIAVARVISVGLGPPVGSYDTYRPADNTLFIPAVQVDDKTYYNVVIGVGTIFDTGVRSLLSYFNTEDTLDPLLACRMEKTALLGNGISIGGFPRAVNRQRSTGTVNTPVILVDFSDAPATKTPQEVYALIAGASDNFTQLSYGKLNYRLQPVLKWYRMGKPAASYAPNGWGFFNHRDYIAEAVALADPDVDFSAADNVVILANPDAKSLTYGPAFLSDPTYAIQADGRRIMNGATSASDLTFWGTRWLNHEISHTFGLPDLYQVNAPGGTNIYRFAGDFSLMGWISGKGPEFTAWERWVLGWVSDAQVQCMTGQQLTQSLTAVETGGGIKAVVVPLSSSAVLVVESRRRKGLDKSLQKEGALVYKIDSQVASGSGPLLVQSAATNDTNFSKAPLAEGESLTVEGVTVRVTRAVSGGDTVSITRVK